MSFKNLIKGLLIFGLIFVECMKISVAASAFKIKDIPKYYIFYLPNRIPVLKDLYGKYQLKNISFKRFAGGIALEGVNVYGYIDLHQIAGECMYDYCMGHGNDVIISNNNLNINNPHANIDFLSNKNIGISAAVIATISFGYYCWKVYRESDKAENIAIE